MNLSEARWVCVVTKTAAGVGGVAAAAGRHCGLCQPRWANLPKASSTMAVPPSRNTRLSTL